MSLLSLVFGLVAAAAPNPVFVYELGDIGPQQQAQLIASNGFAGTVFDHARDMHERLRAVDDAHLQLLALWLTVDVSKGATAYEPGIEEAIRSLQGRNTTVWLAIQGGGDGAEERAVEASRYVADLASRSNLRVALYPHYGFYLPKFRDVMRVAEAAGRSNLGVIFNLCHELRSGFDEDFDWELRQSLPRLYGVTVNGADVGGKDWNRLIQPLGHGSYDVRALLRKIVAAGYRGPVAVQCYGIKQDPASYLPGVMRAWREMARGD